MQSNPSYNIGIGGGLQDDYSQYSKYGTGGSSSSGRHHSRAGGGYDTEYRQQFRTSGGLQVTDDLSYYQRYQDNSGMFVAHICCNQHTEFHKLSTHKTDVGKKLSQLALINVHLHVPLFLVPYTVNMQAVVSN